MADSALESRVQWGLRHITSSFFDIPSFFSSRGSSNSKSNNSPMSPIRFGFFSNLSSQFSLQSPKSPKQNGLHKNWGCKLGLGIIILLVDETKATDVIFNSPKRKHIIFGSDVKTGYSASSNSSSISLSPESSLSSKKFCSENRTNTLSSPSDSFSDTKPSSLPVPIGSLSAREIELSEDYTCIISYGPNPKTTHIFGDCILDGLTNELPNIEQSQETDSLSLTPFQADEGDDIDKYRGEGEFCSFHCCSGEIGETFGDSLKSSQASSYHEDVELDHLFPKSCFDV